MPEADGAGRGLLLGHFVGFDGGDAAEVPIAFVAFTVNVYATPFVRPETVQECGPLVHEQDAPPGLAVTAYPVIGDPPVFAGARHETTLAALTPFVADTFLGVLGSVCNV